MTRSRLPRDVSQLLESGLDSIEKIEALRYLRRAGAAVTRAELMRTLRLEREATDALIRELAAAGLVEINDQAGHLRLGAAGTGAAYDELLRIYDEDRLVIVTALSALAMDRIRNMAARAFGEAFVSLKKPSKDNGEP